MTGGWIKLYRGLITDELWKDCTPVQKTILVTLLLMANHKESTWMWQGKKYKVSPGQFVTSLESIRLSAGKGVSIKNVRSALAKFEKSGFLANQSAKTGRLLTIVNWAKYQLDNEEAAKQSAVEWQRGGKEVATNKNLKTNKNDKTIKTSSVDVVNSSLEAQLKSLWKFYIADQPLQLRSEFKKWLVTQQNSGNNDETVLEMSGRAFQIVCDNNPDYPVAYLESIMKTWNREGFTSDDQIQAHEESRDETDDERLGRLQRPSHLPGSEDGSTLGSINLTEEELPY